MLRWRPVSPPPRRPDAALRGNVDRVVLRMGAGQEGGTDASDPWLRMDGAAVWGAEAEAGTLVRVEPPAGDP